MAARKLAAVPKASVAGTKIIVSWQDIRDRPLTGREIRDLERAQSVSFMALQRKMSSGAESFDLPWDTLLALVWVMHRREDPSFTFDQALDLRIDEWEFGGIAISDVADPTTEPAADTAIGS